MLPTRSSIRAKVTGAGPDWVMVGPDLHRAADADCVLETPARSWVLELRMPMGCARVDRQAKPTDLTLDASQASAADHYYPNHGVIECRG